LVNPNSEVEIVVLTRRTDVSLYRNLEHQCRLMGVHFLEEEPSLHAINTQYDLVGKAATVS
jgi:hypothetical protein